MQDHLDNFKQVGDTLHDDTYTALEVLAIALEHNPEDRYKLTLEYPDIKRLLLHLEKPARSV